MLSPDVMVSTDQSTLEDGEKPLNGVRMGIAARVFLHRMANRRVTLELAADYVVLPRLIRHKVALFVCILIQNATDRLGRSARNMEGANLPAALHESDDSVLVHVPTLSLAGVRLAPPERLIGLNYPALAANLR